MSIGHTLGTKRGTLKKWIFRVHSYSNDGNNSTKMDKSIQKSLPRRHVKNLEESGTLICQEEIEGIYHQQRCKTIQHEQL